MMLILSEKSRDTTTLFYHDRFTFCLCKITIYILSDSTAVRRRRTERRTCVRRSVPRPRTKYIFVEPLSLKIILQLHCRF